MVGKSNRGVRIVKFEAFINRSYGIGEVNKQFVLKITLNLLPLRFVILRSMSNNQFNIEVYFL